MAEGIYPGDAANDLQKQSRFSGRQHVGMDSDALESRYCLVCVGKSLLRLSRATVGPLSLSTL